MGITQKSLDRLTPHIKPGLKMLELGAQNLYDSEHYMQIAKHYFTSLSIEHTSIDVIQHQECEFADLRECLNYSRFDIITNYGTLEHVDGHLYQPLLNIHNAGGESALMIHENPKTGNWPGHGQHYLTKEFWVEMTKACNYELLEVSEEPAMGNEVDGWNVCAVLRKKHNSMFPDRETFDKIYNQHIKSK